MKTIVSVILLFVFLLAQGCVQAPGNARKSSVKSSSTNGNGTTNSDPVAPVSSEALYWYTTTKIVGTITINKNSQDVVYLRGQNIHDFLNSQDQSGLYQYRKQFCFISKFLSPWANKQIRVRAIPQSANVTGKATERLLRIDIPSSAENSSACQYNTIDDIAAADAAYSLPAICSGTGCTGYITTESFSLYEVKTSPQSLQKIPASQLNLSSAILRVDLQSNSTDSSSSCTNSACSAKGFDCCIAGQCVKDGSVKASAASDPQYSQAISDVSKNPLAFINYPNIYYICANITHSPVPTTGDTTLPTPISEAEARVAAYIKDYTCVLEASATVPVYTNCSYGTSTGETAYTAIKKKLAVACGCTASDADMAVKCPDWGIIPVYKAGALQTLSNITDFKCYTPLPANPIGPITNLNVTVPNRSAPHRFFDETGVSFDDLSGLLTKSPSLKQEGESFHYLDSYGKTNPVNGTFNVNSILGSMTIDLNNTIPAKQVTVELGKSYILSATSGYFTPCSQCAKDSWFQSFSPHPNSQRGTGLQASGYTTSRDAYSSNSTFGNYEDTKFGRACYVPVTMLPLSHKKDSNLQTQRLNRLKTQSAYYINGYQRDWYGFNKGALIGSFDGVTWFAIGTGRRITATSSKLFLAINSSFLDLADRTDTIVNIIPDFSANTAAEYDYDPDLALTDPRQNNAATCQRFHQCSVDADCVTQLGWEYTCADVSQFQTTWPLFNTDATEGRDQERRGSLFEILQSNISTTNAKRCVYRGAGAPCKRNYSTLNDYNKKMLTCAPNFYCAAISDTKFNEELVRSPNEFDNILYGMDANVLGRPLNYVTANKTLPSEVQNNIKYSSMKGVGLSSADADDMGICRPGRALVTRSSDDIVGHYNPDNSKRTDYISQVGSCNSNSKTATRFVSCPAFGEDLNYADPLQVDTIIQREMQNSCGGEAKHYSTNVSAFKNIEGASLLTLQNFIQPTLAQDACLRRAGAICHTDLECGPNKLHEEAVGTIDIKFFGETEAEQSYWRESLICGQGTPVPALGSAGYFSYKLSENRCCREIGKDFTMYTQGPKSIVPENAGSNENLKTGKFPYYDPSFLPDSNDTLGPAAKHRYSRYTVSKLGKDEPSKIPQVTATAEPTPGQWQVINETGSKTCCGGGWIRKFADGTHDWKVINRLSLDTSNFSCLNFRSPLVEQTYNSFLSDKVNSITYQREYELLCQNPAAGGCMQIAYPDSTGFMIKSPRDYVSTANDIFNYDPDNASGSNPAIPAAYQNVTFPRAPAAGYARIDTTPVGDISQSIVYRLNVDAPYAPQPYYYYPIPADIDQENGQAYPFFTPKEPDTGVAMYLPAYVPWDGSINNASLGMKVYIKYFYENGAPQLYDITNNVEPVASKCTQVITDGPNDPVPTTYMSGDNSWCITTHAKTSNRPVIIVRAQDHSVGDWTHAGIVIDFKTVEHLRGTNTTTPGNDLYYLSKLGRLELLGVPQITYEPLYCNNDANKLVPGIFKSSILNRTQFVSSSVTYSSNPIAKYSPDSGSTYDTTRGNFENKFTYQDKIAHSAIFSSKDFACCTPLGKTTSSASKCCSGYAASSNNGTVQTCKLPRGTNLNVYFNKFISSEGVGDSQPGGGLTISGDDPDFYAHTGEPKFRDSTYRKIYELGSAYCANGEVVMGAAFGKFGPEPYTGSYVKPAEGELTDSFPLSIVDSVTDFVKDDPNLGKMPFDSGFKWNHHYYCK